MNHVILIGRLTDNPELATLENDHARMVINLAVPRTFRNPDGIYETDFLRCVLWNGIAKRAKEYCKKGDMICVRGRVQKRDYEDEEKKKKYMTEIIVESLAFVSSANNKEKDVAIIESEENFN